MSINVGPLGATLAAISRGLARMLFDGAADVALGFHVETGMSQLAAKPTSINIAPRARRRLQKHPFLPGRLPVPRSAFAEGTAPVGINPSEVDSNE